MYKENKITIEKFKNGLNNFNFKDWKTNDIFDLKLFLCDYINNYSYLIKNDEIDIDSLLDHLREQLDSCCIYFRDCADYLAKFDILELFEKINELEEEGLHDNKLDACKIAYLILENELTANIYEFLEFCNNN